MQTNGYQAAKGQNGFPSFSSVTAITKRDEKQHGGEMVYFISQFGITFSSWEEVTAAGVETAGQIASVSTAERMNAGMLVLS